MTTLGKTWKLSEETKERMSLSKMGSKNPRYGKPHSEEHKQKLREASIRNGNKPPVRSGSDNNLWKGGITPINAKIRSSGLYKKWRTSVLERDNYTCVLCKRVRYKLEVDHIKKFSDYPELRLDIDNGRTLCKPCHEQTDNYKSKRPKTYEK